MKRWLLLLLLACGGALAGPLALPAPPDAGVEQHVGAQLPLDVAVHDEDGRALHLSDLVDGTRPVLLVPGYYRCAQLCGLVMRTVLERLPDAPVRIVGLSIDPTETPADARARRQLDLAYAASLPRARQRPAPDLHLLTLDAAPLQRAATALGLRFTRAPDGTIAHPATLVLLTPRGTVARYFNGMGVDAAELRVAVADAAGDRLGSATGRIALLCAHFDPQVGKLDTSVMNVARAVSLVLVAGLGGWCWRRRGTRPGGRR